MKVKIYSFCDAKYNNQDGTSALTGNELAIYRFNILLSGANTATTIILHLIDLIDFASH